MCMCVPSCPVSTHSPYTRSLPNPTEHGPGYVFTFIMAVVMVRGMTGSQVAVCRIVVNLKQKLDFFGSTILLSGGENSQHPVSIA